MSTIIIITGPPGVGKTLVANKIIKKHSNYILLSYDTLKEKFWDKYGFNNKRQKQLVDEKSLQYFYKKWNII